MYRTEKEKGQCEDIFFNVLEKDKDHLKVAACRDLLELSDNFMTYADFAALADDQIPEYQLQYHNCTRNAEFTLFFYEELDAVLKDWVALMVPGQYKTSKQPPGLLQAVEPHKHYLVHNRLNKLSTDDSDYSMSENYKFLYNRSNLKPRDPSIVKRGDRLLQRDAKNLVAICNQVINNKYNVDIELTRHLSMTERHIIMARKLITWSDMCKPLFHYSGRTFPSRLNSLSPNDKPWLKKLWVNPTLVRPLLETAKLS